MDHSIPYLTITSRWNHTFENETLHKMGWKTGWTYGAVEDTCVDYDAGADVIRLCSDRVDYNSDKGDSGAPVYFRTSDFTAELRGIHYGRENWFWQDAMISDLGQIEKDYGELTVIGGPLTAEISGPSEVPENTSNTWASRVEAGRPPYAYEWRRDGVLVSTTDSYSGSVGTSDFWLVLDVTDDTGSIVTDSLHVTTTCNEETDPDCKV